MFTKEADFDKEIKKNWAYPVLDGITDLKLYKQAKYRILWILKEPNKSDDKKEEWNHRDFHYEGTAGYKRWFVTYKRIHYISYGLLNDDISCRYDIDMETAKINGINSLQQIAIININKSGGEAFSNQAKIDMHYEEKKEILHSQIDGINPEIIINVSRCEPLFNDLSENNKIQKLRNSELRYCITPERLVIDYYHPGVHSKGITDEKYCNDMFNAVKKWANK